MSYPPPSVPSDSAPPTEGARKVKPGKGWYWVGGLLLVGGVVGGAALGVAGLLNLKNSIEDFGRFRVDGGTGAATVTFEEPGTYSIYYESESKVCDDLAAADPDCETVPVRGESDPPARLDISITDGDRSLPISSAENTLDYSLGGFSGTEVATVDVDEAGSYSMVVETRREGEFAIALGKDVVSTIVPWVLGAIAVAVVGFVLGLVILIVTAVKRSRRKREAAMAAATTYPSAPPVFVPTPAPVSPMTPVSPPAPAPAPTMPAPAPAPPVPVAVPLGSDADTMVQPAAPAPPAAPWPSAPPEPADEPSDDHAPFAPPAGAGAWAAPAEGASPPPAPLAPPPPVPADDGHEPDGALDEPAPEGRTDALPPPPAAPPARPEPTVDDAPTSLPAPRSPAPGSPLPPPPPPPA